MENMSHTKTDRPCEECKHFGEINNTGKGERYPEVCRSCARLFADKFAPKEKVGR